jgi:hypothetical protein
MVMVYSDGLMAKYTKAILLRTNVMGKDYLNGKMAESMMENGLGENSTV